MCKVSDQLGVEVWKAQNQLRNWGIELLGGMHILYTLRLGDLRSPHHGNLVALFANVGSTFGGPKSILDRPAPLLSL